MENISETSETMPSVKGKALNIKKITVSVTAAVLLAVFTGYVLLEFAFVPYPAFVIKHYYKKYESDFIYASEHLDRNSMVLYRADNMAVVSQETAEDEHLRECLERIINNAHIYKITSVIHYSSDGDSCDSIVFLSESSLNEKYTRGIVVTSADSERFYCSEDMILGSERINENACYVSYEGRTAVPLRIQPPE